VDDWLNEISSPPSSTGIPGLDDILSGGFPAHQLHLVEGSPGTGKTTLALQFLLAGRERGEAVLYVTLSETRRELLAVARSHGWSLDGIHIQEMEPLEEGLAPEQQVTLFHPSELELSETTSKVLKTVQEIQPSRVVFDSLSEMRLLAQSSLRFRRQILGIKQFFSSRQITVLLLDDLTGPGDDLQLQSIAHGVVRLEHLATEYGAERRRLRVLKMRATEFRGGLHDFVIRRGGMDVFPRLIAAEHHAEFEEREAPSGIASFDRLLGGGLLYGSSTLLVGPAGTGKSSQIRRAVAVLKKRSGAHELTLRELRMDSQGISISEPLYDFQGVLTGVPTYHGEGDPRNQP